MYDLYNGLRVDMPVQLYLLLKETANSRFSSGTKSFGKMFRKSCGR